jgi:urease accessory protein
MVAADDTGRLACGLAYDGSMITVDKLLPQGRGLAPALLKRAATVELDWDTRCRSRFDATDSAGRALGIFLPRGTQARGGDVLVAEDGSLVKVVAASQPVVIARPAVTGSPFDLVRAAYHLGNRHVQIELRPDHVKIEPDHVLAEMLRRMGLDVSEGVAPFEPEGGAYAAVAPGHAHGHDHGHAHDHRHDDAHAHGHDEHGQGHVHGPGCGHDHHGH